MNSSGTGIKYRPDIDGLRAIAVVSVILYHAGIHAFPGGFSGVDVFFVISGYLITRLIYVEFHGQRFSIVAFYGRRARRILPALFVVLLFASVAAYRLLLPADMVHFGRSLLAVLFFCSNALFSQSTDYFAPAAGKTPLLHMWSLSVEEQFYILYPVFLTIVMRCLPRHCAFIISALLLLSLAWDIRSFTNSLEAFYSTSARAWELLLGGLIALKMLPDIKRRALGSLLGLLGLSLIGCALLVPLPQSASYFFATFSAATGTALVLQSGEEGGIVTRILSLRALVFTGLISYSLYLWHWVFLVFARLALQHPLALHESAVVIAAAVVVSGLSWRFIETPFRKITQIKIRRWMLAVAILYVCLLVAFGALIDMTQGIPGRFTGAMGIFAAGRGDYWPRWDECKDQICHVGPAGASESFMLWGDSHAGSLAPAMERIAQERHIAGYVAFNPGCPPAAGLHNSGATKDECPGLARNALSFIGSHHVATVLLHANWTSYVTGAPSFVPGVDGEARLSVFAQQMRVTLKELKSSGVRIVIIASVPRVQKTRLDTPEAFAQRAHDPDLRDVMESRPQFLQEEAAIFAVLRQLAADYSAEIIYPHEALCDGATCRGAQGNALFYTDDQHLSVHGAMFLLPMLEKVFAPASGSDGGRGVR